VEVLEVSPSRGGQPHRTYARAKAGWAEEETAKQSSDGTDQGLQLGNEVTHGQDEGEDEGDGQMPVHISTLPKPNITHKI
jgi:hypothetical protein